LKQKKGPVLDITGFNFSMSTQMKAEVRSQNYYEICLILMKPNYRHILERVKELQSSLHLNIWCYSTECTLTVWFERLRSIIAVLFYLHFNIHRFSDIWNIFKRKYEVLICIILEWVSEWLLFNANSAIFLLYHGENMLIFNEIMMSSD
jgi:hypothetical protein